MKRKRSDRDDGGKRKRRKKEKTPHTKKTMRKLVEILEHNARVSLSLFDLVKNIPTQLVRSPPAVTSLVAEDDFDERDKNAKIVVTSAKKWQDKKAMWLEKFGADTLFVDVTKTGEYNRFCPFTELGGIIVPNSDGMKYSDTVQGIFEAFKIFSEDSYVALNLLQKKPRKRKANSKKDAGELKGWQKGLLDEKVIPLSEARWIFFIDVYKSVLEKKLLSDVQYLKDKIKKVSKVIILDNVTNTDVNNYAVEDISHGYLLKCFLEGHYPTRKEVEKGKYTVV